jgi:hypothetical protein
VTSFTNQKGNLIDRYVMEVGRRLPQKQRADVQLELRSALQDSLDERGLDADKEADEAKIVELLKEFGKPGHVAEGYGARNFLIGPELQPFYWWVLRIAAFGVSIAFLVQLVIAAVNQTDFATLVGSTIGGLFNSLLVSFAMVTIIFAVLERYMPGLHLPAREWDPRELPEITPKGNEVDRLEFILEVVFTSVFISVINLLPHWQVPADLAIAGELIAKFLPFIPWLTALAIVQLVLDIYLLMQGRWTLLTRWVSFGHAAGSVALIAATLTIAPYSSELLVDSIIQFSVRIAIIVSVIDAALKLYRALRPGVPFPWESWRLEQAIEEMAEEGEAFGQAMTDRVKKQRKSK